MQARDHISEQFKEAARRSESRPFPGMEKVWQRIEDKLDGKEQIQDEALPFPGMDRVWNKIEERLDGKDEKKNRVIPFRKISIAAAAAVVITFSIFYFATNENTTPEQPTYAGKLESSQQTATPIPVTPENAVPLVTQQPQPAQPLVQAIEKVKRQYPAYTPSAVRVPDQLTLAAQTVPTQSDNETYFARTISGTVIDEYGDPLAGALVLVPGMKQGTMTGIDGRYEIQLNGGPVELQIKALGMSTQTVAVGKNDVKLATILTADPNTAADVYLYGNKQDDKAYAGTDKTGNKSLTNIDKAIAGELPGVNIKRAGGLSENSADLMTRPLGSSTGSNGTPLVVIDGAMYNGTSIAIKPSEVESYVVLKDDDARTIYGAKGANGVIVIKTKAGKGAQASKPGFMQKVKSIFGKKK